MIIRPLRDVPYPFYPEPPERPEPRRHEPLMVPIVYESSGRDPIDRLYEQRTILLGGMLDSATASRVAAELMSLDGRSADPIELLVNCRGGPIEDVFSVLDVMALVRGAIVTTCFGSAHGTAAAVLASGTGGRRATANASISLRYPDADVTARAPRDVETAAEQHRRVIERLATHLHEVTGLPFSRVEHELTNGGFVDAAGAVEIGLVDRIADRVRF